MSFNFVELNYSSHFIFFLVHIIGLHDDVVVEAFDQIILHMS